MMEVEYPSVPPEGVRFLSVRNILSDYLPLKNEISYLEARLKALPAEAPEEASLRRMLLRDRLRVLKTEQAVLSLRSPLRRRLVEARYLEGMSWQEIAGLFSVSERSLFLQHRKALAELEERIR